MAHTRETMLIIGASRGIGAAVAAHLSQRDVELLTVSRSPASVGTWIEADMATSDGIARVIDAVGQRPLDALLYLGGVWEEGAFTDAYDFRASSDAETRFVLGVNLVAPIELTKALVPNLVRTANPRAVFMGSVTGLDNAASAEVANSASKFGLRGAAQAMRLALRGHGIAFTVVNPGNVATAEVEADIAEGRFAPQTPIALADVAAAVDCALAMSPASEITEINLGQRRPSEREPSR